MFKGCFWQLPPTSSKECFKHWAPGGLKYTLTSFQRTVCFLLEIKSGLKTWADFISNSFSVLTISYPNPNSLGSFITWVGGISLSTAG